MFGTLLDKTTGWLGQRLVTTVLLPALAFWAGLAALLATHFGWPRVGAWWKAADGLRQVLVAGGAIAGLVLFALLVQSLLPAVIRAYEGYWLLRRPWRGVGGLLVRRHRNRWDKLDLADPRLFAYRYRHLPPDRSGLLPTRLGNTLRAAELYVSDERRYGIDAVFFWPRLHALLPEALRQSLAAARGGVEQMLVVASLAVVLSVTTLVFAFTLRIPVAVWVPVAAGGLVLAVAAYRGAVGAAGSYGELVRSAFDTHRMSLVDSMGYRRPASPEEERALWKAVGQQLYRRDADQPDLLRYNTEI